MLIFEVTLGQSIYAHNCNYTADVKSPHPILCCDWLKSRGETLLMKTEKMAENERPSGGGLEYFDMNSDILAADEFGNGDFESLDGMTYSVCI